MLSFIDTVIFQSQCQRFFLDKPQWLKEYSGEVSYNSCSLSLWPEKTVFKSSLYSHSQIQPVWSVLGKKPWQDRLAGR